MRSFIYIFGFLLCIGLRALAQDKTADYFVYSDLVLDAESIPNAGFEKFFFKNEKLRSWRVSGGYQVQYNDSFGVVASHGDRVSIGVYQGPGVKLGYTVYNPKRRKHWENYFTVGIGFKYLWYNNVYVNTGQFRADQSYREQSEKCYAAIPQMAIGAKRVKKNFCSDFFIGVQMPVKDRQKTIIYDQTGVFSVNPNVPYSKTQWMVEPALLVGINIGYLKLKPVGKVTE